MEFNTENQNGSIQAQVDGSSAKVNVNLDLNDVDKYLSEVSDVIGTNFTVFQAPDIDWKDTSVVVKVAGAMWVANIVGLIIGVWFGGLSIYTGIAHGLGILLLPVGMVMGASWIALFCSEAVVIILALGLLYLYTKRNWASIKGLLDKL